MDWPDFIGVSIHQYIYDPTASDELVQFRSSDQGATVWSSAHWGLTDRRHNLIGLLDANAATEADAYASLQRIRYSSYGVPTPVLRSDINGDGDVDTDDLALALSPALNTSYGAATYRADADINGDGVIDNSDVAIYVADFNAQLIAHEGSLWNNACAIGYAGSVYDPAVQLALMRNRWYDAELGRWITRDPAGYVDGMSLYMYVSGNPLLYYDPFGLTGVQIRSQNRADRFFSGELDREGFMEEIRAEGMGALIAVSLFIPGPEDLVLAGLTSRVVAKPVAAAAKKVTQAATQQAAKHAPAIVTKTSGLLARFAGRVLGRGAGKADEAATLKKSRRQQLEQNQIQGKEFEENVLRDLENTQDNIAKQITVKSNESGTSTRVEFVGNDKQTGNIRLTEAKSSDTAPFTKNQNQLFRKLKRAVVRSPARARVSFLEEPRFLQLKLMLYDQNRSSTS